MVEKNTIETHSSISLEWLFQLRLKLDNLIKKIDDQKKKALLQDLLDFLLLEVTPNDDDILKKGIYKVLILGVSDLSIINDFVGINTSALFSQEDYYLFSINRSFRDRNLVIEFIQDSNISEDNQRIIASVFRNKNPETNIDSYLKLKEIPSLVIKEFDLSLFQILDDDIKLLKSTNLIKKIKLDINFLVDNSRTVSFFRSIDIIPQGYKFVDQINALKFREYFPNSGFYNFIILNAQNDYLIKAFFELLSLYEEKFYLKGEFSQKILEKIFYVLDSNIFNETRFLKENNEYQEKIESIFFQNHISLRHNPQTILLFLNYLQHYLLKNFHIKNKNNCISENLVESVHNIKKLLSSIRSYTESYPAKYETFHLKLLELEEIVNEKREMQITIIKGIVNLELNNNNREVFLSKIERELFIELVEISKGFNNLLSEKIRKVLEDQKKQFQQYLKKRKIRIFKTYYKDDIDFNKFVVSTVFTLLNTIKNSQKIDMVYTKAIDECSVLQKSINSYLEQLQDNLDLVNTNETIFELSETLSLEILSLMTMTNSISI